MDAQDPLDGTRERETRGKGCSSFECWVVWGLSVKSVLMLWRAPAWLQPFAAAWVSSSWRNPVGLLDTLSNLESNHPPQVQIVDVFVLVELRLHCHPGLSAAWYLKHHSGCHQHTCCSD